MNLGFLGKGNGQFARSLRRAKLGSGRLGLKTAFEDWGTHAQRRSIAVLSVRGKIRRASGRSTTDTPKRIGVFVD